MRRKVARIGPATLMISLPSKWAKRYGIKKGDELEIKDNGKSIVVSVDQSKNIEKTSIDISNLDERVIKWTLSALHKSGYDEIEVNYAKKEAAKIVQEMVRNVLMGFAIVDQTDKKIVLRSVAQDISSEFDAALRRAFLVTLSLGENSLELIKNNKFDELDGLINLEQTNNQLTNFCERILNKYGAENERLKSFWYVIVWNLEKVCDEYKYICNLSFSKNLSKEILDYYAEVNSLLKEYYELFYNFNLNKVTEFEIKARGLQTKGMGLAKNNHELVYRLHRIASNLREFLSSTIALNQLSKSDS